MEMTADMTKMKERIEYLSRPNKREQQLEEVIEKLRSENIVQLAQIEGLHNQRQQDADDRGSLRQLLDWLGMSSEDTILSTKRRYETLLQISQNQINLLENQLQTTKHQVKDFQTICRNMQISESLLMAHEDRMTKTSLLMARVLRAQKVLMPSLST